MVIGDLDGVPPLLIEAERSVVVQGRDHPFRKGVGAEVVEASGIASG